MWPLQMLVAPHSVLGNRGSRTRLQNLAWPVEAVEMQCGSIPPCHENIATLVNTQRASLSNIKVQLAAEFQHHLEIGTWPVCLAVEGRGVRHLQGLGEGLDAALQARQAAGLQAPLHIRHNAGSCRFALPCALCSAACCCHCTRQTLDQCTLSLPDTQCSLTASCSIQLCQPSIGDQLSICCCPSQLAWLSYHPAADIIASKKHHFHSQNCSIMYIMQSHSSDFLVVIWLIASWMDMQMLPADLQKHGKRVAVPSST